MKKKEHNKKKSYFNSIPDQTKYISVFIFSSLMYEKQFLTLFNPKISHVCLNSRTCTNLLCDAIMISDITSYSSTYTSWTPNWVVRKTIKEFIKAKACKDYSSNVCVSRLGGEMEHFNLLSIVVFCIVWCYISFAYLPVSDSSLTKDYRFYGDKQFMETLVQVKSALRSRNIFVLRKDESDFFLSKKRSGKLF